MERSERIKNLAIAQMKMQKELRNLELNAQGFNYKYASLDHLLNYARQMCSKYGLSFVQNPIGTETTIGIETIYMHESGEFLVGNLESPIGGMKGMNVYQSSGSAITYLRRYALMSFLGVFGEEDIDAKGFDVYEKKSKPKTAKPKTIESDELPF